MFPGGGRGNRTIQKCFGIVKVVFVQPEFPQKSAETIADAIDGVVVKLNPLNPDYIENLKKIAREVKKALH